MHFVSEGQQIPSNRQRGRPGTNQGNTLAIFFGGHMGQVRSDIPFVVRCSAFEATNRHRRFLGANTPTGRLARTITRSPQYTGKHIGVPIEHVGFGITLLRNQADVLRNRRVCRTGVLAIDYFVKVVWIKNICWFHTCFERHGPVHTHAPAGSFPFLFLSLYAPPSTASFHNRRGYRETVAQPLLLR